MKYIQLDKNDFENGQKIGVLSRKFLKKRLKLFAERKVDKNYVDKNFIFMKKAFPKFAYEFEGYCEINKINQYLGYLLHGYFHNKNAGCSAVAFKNKNNDLYLISISDVSNSKRLKEKTKEVIYKYYVKDNIELCGLGNQFSLTMANSINSNGLAVGTTSAHPRIAKKNNPNSVNIFFLIRLISQYCNDCNDVKSFVKEYTCSGQKGLNGIAIDKNDYILGFEIDSNNYAFREKNQNQLLEVNHWQSSLKNRVNYKKFYESSYFFNSQNRINYFYKNIDKFRKTSNVQDIEELLLNDYSPGMILQRSNLNIGNWATGIYTIYSSKKMSLDANFYPFHPNMKFSAFLHRN